MKRVIIIILITVIVMGIIIGIGYYNRDEIYRYYQYEYLKVRDNITIDKNEYYKDNSYEYIENTNDFLAKDKDHLKKIFYTIINSGEEKFTFYCDDLYKECINDVVDIVNNKDLLSNMNNFVHPYNSFDKINASYDDFGKISVEVKKVYSDEDIRVLDERLEEIISKNIKGNESSKEKIEIIHDYIINNGKYATDKIRKENQDKLYNKANDILIEGLGLCSSYADAMALFLYEFGINNYKIASDTHIWNLVYLDNEWLHLDLTWDDPVTNTGEDRLDILFLLIDNDRLEELKVEQHDYDKEVYKEALN